MSKDSHRRRVTVVLTIVILTALTGCWSMQSFVLENCKCDPERMPTPARR